MGVKQWPLRGSSGDPGRGTRLGFAGGLGWAGEEGDRKAGSGRPVRALVQRTRQCGPCSEPRNPFQRKAESPRFWTQVVVQAALISTLSQALWSPRHI